MADFTDTTIERWLPIPGYEGLYDVSDMGRIRPRRKPRNERDLPIKSQIMSKKGYMKVNLFGRNKISKRIRVHNLVLLAFVGQRPEGYHINHINFLRADNRLSNLEYVTPEQNIKHSEARTRQAALKGSRNGNAKLNEYKIVEIRAMRSAGKSTVELATLYGVTKAIISKICLRRLWRHVL